MDSHRQQSRITPPFKEPGKKNAFSLALSAVLIAFFSAVLFLTFYFVSKRAALPSEAADAGVTVVDEAEEMRGVWIATLCNINFPSGQGLSSDALRAELDDIAETAASLGLNTIFFQVRPTADALYPSSIFPTSAYLTGKQGDPLPDGFDPLAYLIAAAGKRGIAVHAWINPLRVTVTEEDENTLAPNNPAVLHPEYTVKYADGRTYFDPGRPEVRDLVVSGIRELVTKYPALAGVHFDDYFYPYPVAGAVYDDSHTYALYGGGLSLADWRRSNVNALVKASYEAVKSVDPAMSFGVSPFGIYANENTGTKYNGSKTNGLQSYSDLYCDTLAWVDGGYVDYLIPQLYWSFSTPAAPFDNIARWWNAVLDGKNVALYFGHAAYKAPDYPKNEIGIQVEFSRTLLSYRGSVYYGYADIKKNSTHLADKIRSLNTITPIPARSTGSQPSITFPAGGSNVTAQTLTLLGASDVSRPFAVDGEPVSRTKSGMFSLYTTLSSGVNVYTLKQDETTTSYPITFKTTRAAASSAQTLANYAVTDISPAEETWLATGETLTVSCTAPAGSTVTAAVGGMTIVLSPVTGASPVPGSFVKETYRGSVTPANFAGEDQLVTLGTLKITASDGTGNASASGALVKQIGSHALVYAEVASDYSHVKISPTSSFYEDYTPANKGMRDYIRAKSGTYYRLAFGGYVNAENVRVVEGVELPKNILLSVETVVNAADTSNNKNNFTDIIFRGVAAAPVNVVAHEGYLTLTFYNTDTAILPDPDVIANPLFRKISAAVVNESTLRYTVTLKDAFHAFGYDVLYENGSVILRLNNPQSLAEGEKPLAGKTILVDAGHGGIDNGALGSGRLDEKDLNLGIALALEKKLTALGASVVMTRRDDTTVALLDRAAYFNEVRPDFLISVHQNSVPNTANLSKVRGYLGLFCAEAGRLAAKTVSGVVTDELNRYERPYAYQELAVCRNHRFVSTLSEMCFITNIEEYEWSIAPGAFERSAEALANGIIAYYKAQEAYLDY